DLYPGQPPGLTIADLRRPVQGLGEEPAVHHPGPRRGGVVMEAGAAVSSPASLARRLAECAARDSRPRDPRVHLLDHGPGPQLLVVNGTRLYDLSDATAATVPSTPQTS